METFIYLLRTIFPFLKKIFIKSIANIQYEYYFEVYTIAIQRLYT